MESEAVAFEIISGFTVSNACEDIDKKIIIHDDGQRNMVDNLLDGN